MSKLTFALEKNQKYPIICFDSGKGYSKEAYEVKDKGKAIFKTNITPSVVMPGMSEIAETTYINDKPFRFYQDVQKAVETSSVKTKQDKVHMQLVQKRLFELSKLSGQDIFDVILGCSLDIYKDNYRDNQKDRVKEFQEFAKHYLNKFTVKEEGVEKTIKVKNIVIRPETLSSLVGGVEITSNKAFMVDLGTLNNSFIPIINKTPKYESSVTGYEGYHYLIKKLTSYINDNLSKDTYDEDGIINYVENFKDTDKADKELNLLISEYFKTEYIKTIRNKLAELNCDKFSQIIFTGGTAQTFKKEIQDSFRIEVQFVKDPVVANVTGMYWRGKKELLENK